MSIKIAIHDSQAVLADGKWRSANVPLRDLLNDHLASIVIPGHYPPSERERFAPQAAVDELGCRIIDQHPQPADSRRLRDGRLGLLKQ